MTVDLGRFLWACLFLLCMQAGGWAANPTPETNVLTPYRGPSFTGVDTTTLKGKVMCGYQGWFNCEGDGADLGWTHWARNSKRVFGPDNITVDLWPDVSEHDDDELYETGFHYQDGRAARVFSSYNRKTVIRHFEWMRGYGIHGAFLQRFANGLRKPAMRRHKDTVLSNVREAANRAGLTYAVMYDLSGLPKGGTTIIQSDWKMLQSRMEITQDPAYLHHNGKPLVSIWGIGFNSKTKPRRYTLEECRALVEFFREQRCSIMIGAPTGWRSLDRDAVSDPGLHEILRMADVISPWTPGRYRDLSGVAEHAEEYWRDDVRWCKRHDIDYFPVVFPGFSWFHQKGDKLGSIPRLKGQFLWSQFVAATAAGAEMIYVAMFDEVDEGTAIFKCTNSPPTGDGVPFLTLEGLPSDHYLWLSGMGGRLLRGEINPTRTPPPRKERRQAAVGNAP